MRVNLLNNRHNRITKFVRRKLNHIINSLDKFLDWAETKPPVMLLLQTIAGIVIVLAWALAPVEWFMRLYFNHIKPIWDKDAVTDIHDINESIIDFILTMVIPMLFWTCIYLYFFRE